MKIWKIIAIVAIVLGVFAAGIIAFMGYGAKVAFEESTKEMEPRLTVYIAAPTETQNQMIAEDLASIVKDIKAEATEDASSWDAIQNDATVKQLAIEMGRSWYATRITSSDTLSGKLTDAQRAQFEQEAEAIGERTKACLEAIDKIERDKKK